MQIPYTFPWGLHPMEDWIITELERRATEKDINATSDIKNQVYSGPKTAWSRVFSNGKSSLAPELDGFVMGGTEGFNDSYGFNSSGSIVIGVDAKGKPHTVDANGISIAAIGTGNKKERSMDFPYRPPPSVVFVETQFVGGSNSSFNALCKKTTITWKCYSLAQLEYLTPYFLTPRITVLVEWGWNHYDNTSLIDLQDIDWMYNVFLGKWEYTGEWIKASNGNYDLAMGFITDYSIDLNENGGYDCTTVITNANYLLEGQSYQTKSSTKKEGDEKIQLKDFTEFVFNDVYNLEIKQKNNKTAPIKLTTKGKIFVDPEKNEQWLRMDLIAEIINSFFAIKLLDGSGTSETGIKCMTFDINGVPICAHPSLKSVDPNFLFPNQFSPRFTVSGSADNTLTTVKAQSGEYFVLFPEAKNIITKYSMDSSYDDLRSIINPISGSSFPVFEDYNGLFSKNSPKAGYWGYLQDVFVSVSTFKTLVERNDTVLKLLEELLQRISQAMCNISQLQLCPSTLNNTVYTVIDSNLSVINTNKDAESLPRVSVFSNNSAFIRSATFAIKLSGEMANQMVMQSASGIDLSSKYGTSVVDAKVMRVSKFATGDRMFDRAVTTITVPSNKSPQGQGDRIKLERKLTTQNKNFYIYKIKEGKKIVSHILAETNPEFLKSILMDVSNKNASYINNAIMPGTNFTMTLLGIGGITFLSQFTLEHVLSSYNYERCVWQVSDVKQRIENKVWTTTVIAQARPLTTLAQ